MTGHTSSDLYLAFLRPNSEARLRLYCFHHAGGGASAFRQWSSNLPPGIDVCPVRLPGREGRVREPPFTNIWSLVEKLVEALSPHLKTPFAFFGHSMGALICFELARSLRHQRDVLPLQLFVAGHRAPHLATQRPPIHDLPTPLFLEKLKDLNGTPETVLRDAELMQFFLPVLRADFKLLETYVFNEAKPFDCPITAFGGLDDKVASEKEMADWSAHTQKAFKLHMLPGGHFFLNHARPTVLRAIAADLGNRMVLA